MNLQRDYGLYVSPGLGEAFPDGKRLLGRIYSERVSKLPWIPGDWLRVLSATQAANPGALVRIASAKVIVPAFCSTPERVAYWNDLAERCDAAVRLMAQQRAEEGKAELEEAYADSRFWNEGMGATLIKTATAIRDLPANAVGAVADGAGAVAGGILKRLASSWIVWAGVLVVGGIAAVRFGLIKLPKKAK